MPEGTGSEEWALKGRKAISVARGWFSLAIVDPELIAEPPHLRLRAHKLSEVVVGTMSAGDATLAQMGELAGKLRFAQSAAMGRVGRVALRLF